MRRKFLICLFAGSLIFWTTSAYSGTNDTARYSTKGHAKAKDIDMTFKYPSTWEASEGERPNIVQKFSKNLGNGITLTCGLMIKNIPTEATSFSEKEIAAEIFSEAGIRTLLGSPASFELLEHKQTKYDGQPGARSSFIEKKSRVGVEIYSHVLQHVFLYKNKIVLLSCAVGGLKSNSDEVESAYKKYLPSFILMGASIVLNDKW